MAHKWFAKVAVVALTLSLLAGCGGAKQQPPAQTPSNQTPSQQQQQQQQQPQQPQEQTPAKVDFTVGMATDVGGLNDDSFNAAAYRGILRAEEELGVDKIVIESKRQEDYPTNFQLLIDGGADLVWGIGFMMQAALDEMAQANPNQKFAIIDEVVNQPNVASVTFKEHEGSFLMGFLAGKSTKTGKVGFVGGMESPVIGRFEAGYRAGVKAANPDVEVIVVYSNSFVDPAKGKSDALAIYNQGADIIFHAAGGTGQGVIEAAVEKNLFAIGVDSDQNYLAPEHVISSMMKRVDVAVYEVIKMAVEDEFPAGQHVVLGLAEDGVGYAPSTLWNKLPEGLQAEVDKWAQAIKDGKVTVPDTPEAVNAWTAPTL
ncbi:basic membrane protein A [Symbiobacterium terraclitae]|uniref:Basic membrane protein A n=1 Tax=Symbiobacterium terraclitae TaxID=557451 RepID=A0ABS4JQB0_9FIRM|nr:BMP family ABC transporter substrate-binding protein [Symbiobacterium terraclitae]MBP2017130.1 basic membrane protein A [Symbiobacterium terraclitae]